MHKTKSENIDINIIKEKSRTMLPHESNKEK